MRFRSHTSLPVFPRSWIINTRTFRTEEEVPVSASSVSSLCLCLSELPKQVVHDSRSAVLPPGAEPLLSILNEFYVVFGRSHSLLFLRCFSTLFNIYHLLNSQRFVDLIV